MNRLVAAGIDYGTLADVISCILAIIALIFTLYFWLLDHLSDDETKFLEGKSETLDQLKKAADVLEKEKNEACLNRKNILETVEKVNRRLEVILNYRFWSRSKQREEYVRIYDFCCDSRYLISALRRSVEKGTVKGEPSVFAISSEELNTEKLKQICAEYMASLMEIIEFFENWN